MQTRFSKIYVLVTGQRDKWGQRFYKEINIKYNMDENNALVVFQDNKIRRIWNNEQWYFSVIEIVAILTEQKDYQKVRKYWNKLNQRLRDEGSEVVTNCRQLKLIAEDGKLFKRTRI